MHYYVDGITIGSNSSKVGGGFTVLDEKGNLTERPEIKGYFTNNEGELLGISYAVAKAAPGDTVFTEVRHRLGGEWEEQGAVGPVRDLRGNPRGGVREGRLGFSERA